MVKTTLSDRFSRYIWCFVTQCRILPVPDVDELQHSTKIVLQSSQQEIYQPKMYNSNKRNSLHIDTYLNAIINSRPIVPVLLIHHVHQFSVRTLCISRKRISKLDSFEKDIYKSMSGLCQSVLKEMKHPPPINISSYASSNTETILGRETLY